MRKGLLISALILIINASTSAQKICHSQQYQTLRYQEQPSLSFLSAKLDNFIREHAHDLLMGRGQEAVITIPVVVHVLYHSASQKISDEQVQSQIGALNTCFRRRNTDSVNTPEYFRGVAADCNIEFRLAVSDPRRRATTGIIRKYTPVKEWEADDKMKFTDQMGDDAWDPDSYFNIWVCNLNRVAGYASVPGDAAAKDGIVIGFPAFGTINTISGYEMGKTAVHETGHWLGLKHIWGDDYCGDDGVADTPNQAGFNIGCPGVINITCGNGPYGDMYMNYMDLTSDDCMNLFTKGQKARMRALFEAGGPRHNILVSKGLNPPLIAEMPLPEDDPRWLQPKIYPNPAVSHLILDLSYDSRWIGEKIFVTNLQGQSIMNEIIVSKIQQVDISRLPSGLYFIAAKKDDGESMKLKFVKF